MVAYYQPEMDTPKLSDKQNVFKEKWNNQNCTKAANMLQIASQRTCRLDC